MEKRLESNDNITNEKSIAPSSDLMILRCSPLYVYNQKEDMFFTNFYIEKSEYSEAILTLENYPDLTILV